jgi:hypothetical protein
MIGWILAATVSVWSVGLLAYTHLQQPTPHTPKFTYGQCFAKAGLREPWDLDVAGRVYLRGYTKYIVMYASEADRATLAAKSGWEEDIREFDKKYQVAPCPESWVKHTHKK